MSVIVRLKKLPDVAFLRRKVRLVEYYELIGFLVNGSTLLMDFNNRKVFLC